jgi:hypothetical protein
MGSETVLVMGMFAARANNGATEAGDFLQGAGPPNQIMTGSPDVLIGTPAIGVARASNVAAFCREYCQLVRDWPSLTPVKRRNRYESVLAHQAAAFGAPALGTSQNLAAGADASFDRGQWRVNVADDAWTASGPPEGGATMHEIRHAEQLFLAMRVSGGTRPADVSPAARAAAAAQPLDTNTSEGRMGWLHLGAAPLRQAEGA